MTKTFKLAGLLAALGFLSLATGTASASTINFSFQNNGSIADAESCGANCLLVTTTGTAIETGGLDGLNSWTFSGVMQFSSTGWFSAEGDGTGSGLGWSFTDNSGDNNLYGSFSSEFVSILGLLGSGTVDYLIAGGTGLFSGATGVGTSTMSFLANWFTEKGVMSVNVPEPGMAPLFAVGLGMIGFMAYRRRRAPTKL